MNARAQETETATELPGNNQRHGDRLEMLFTLIMAFAAIATAWSGFESSSWGSVQSSFTAQSSAKRIEANRKATEAGQLRNLISEKEGGAQWYCAFDPERVAILLVGGDKSSARLMTP